MLEPVHCGRVSPAPLLPKLRGNLAEFLDNASSAGLRILSSPTCVGLRYGPCKNNSGFSRQMSPALRYFVSLPIRYLPFAGGFASLPEDTLGPVFPFPARLLHPRPHKFCLTGVQESYTCCPSATPSGLALGPDLPRADQLYPGNLGYSAEGIPTLLSLLIPAFSLPVPPQLLFGYCFTGSGDAPLPLLLS